MKTKYFLIIFLSVLIGSLSPARAAEIKGKISYRGEIPASREIDMKIDPNCRSFQSGPVYEENLLMDKDGGVQNVFVYLKTGVDLSSVKLPAESVALTQNRCMYRPRVFGIQVGQNLEIMSHDATLHNVRAMPEHSQKFNIGMPFEGMKITKKFSEPEIMVTIQCDVHPWMRAYAGVLPHPYFAVTDEKGEYVIPNVPNGDYGIGFWHETLGEMGALVQILQDQTYVLDMEYSKD